jgi:hypothetical protein
LQTLWKQARLAKDPDYGTSKELMPSAPLYVHRLEEAMEALSRLEMEWIDRRTLEELLAVSKWTAWRLLKACGASEGPGGALTIQRAELIERLRQLREDGRVAIEAARRTRLETYLEGMARFAGARKEIVRDEAALELVSTKLASLPPGVELSCSELRIEFDGTEDFLAKFGAVVYALHNDYQRIREFIESACGSSK